MHSLLYCLHDLLCCSQCGNFSSRSDDSNYGTDLKHTALSSKRSRLGTASCSCPLCHLHGGVCVRVGMVWLEAFIVVSVAVQGVQLGAHIIRMHFAIEKTSRAKAIMIFVSKVATIGSFALFTICEGIIAIAFLQGSISKKGIILLSLLTACGIVFFVMFVGCAYRELSVSRQVWRRMTKHLDTPLLTETERRQSKLLDGGPKERYTESELIELH